MPKNDAYDKEILGAYEKGQLKSVATKAELAKLKAAARATAIAAAKTWDVVWDTLLADYLRLHRPSLR
jgi:hypothetical protein